MPNLQTAAACLAALPRKAFGTTEQQCRDTLGYKTKTIDCLQAACSIHLMGTAMATAQGESVQPTNLYICKPLRSVTGLFHTFCFSPLTPSVHLSHLEAFFSLPIHLSLKNLLNPALRQSLFFPSLLLLYHFIHVVFYLGHGIHIG